MKTNWSIHDDFCVRRTVFRKPFQTKNATFIVACVALIVNKPSSDSESVKQR